MPEAMVASTFSGGAVAGAVDEVLSGASAVMGDSGAHAGDPPSRTAIGVRLGFPSEMGSKCLCTM
jgi:hypothetical protein